MAEEGAVNVAELSALDLVSAVCDELLQRNATECYCALPSTPHSLMSSSVMVMSVSNSLADPSLTTFAALKLVEERLLLCLMGYTFVRIETQRIKDERS